MVWRGVSSFFPGNSGMRCIHAPSPFQHMPMLDMKQICYRRLSEASVSDIKVTDHVANDGMFLKEFLENRGSVVQW